MTARAKAPLLTFAFLTTFIYAVAVSVSRMAALEHPEVVKLGLMFDLLITVPLAFYLLAVRRGGVPAFTLTAVLTASFAGAALVFPGERALLGRLFEIVSIPAEIGLVAWVAVRTRRALRSAGGPSADDLPERLRAVAREVLPLRRAADAIACEMTVLFYALFAWRRRPHAPADRDAFPYHEKSGYGAIVFALLIVVLGETIPIHILVTRWSSTAAWVLTVLSLYSLFWFLADWRATRLRPHLLDENALQIRTGLRWSVHVPRERIAAVHTKLPKGAGPVLRAALPGGNPLWIELTEPVIAQGPYGIEKRTRWISVTVDDRERFRAAVLAQGASMLQSPCRTNPAQK